MYSVFSWVLDPFTQKVARLSPDGKILAQASVAPDGSAIMATCVVATPESGCWVTDSNNGLVVKLSVNGQKVMNIQGFNQPKPIAVGYLVK